MIWYYNKAKVGKQLAVWSVEQNKNFVYTNKGIVTTERGNVNNYWR